MDRRTFSMAAAGAAASLASGALWAQSRNGPGVTDKEILLGNVSPQSGPAASSGVVVNAANAFFRKINDDGGINGRKIRLLILDDGYNPARTVEMARKLVEEEEVLATFLTLGTAPNTAIQKYMNQKRVPQLFVSTGASKFGDFKNYPWTLGWQPTGYTEAKIFVAHLLETKPNAKIAIFFQNDDFGKDYVKGFKEALGDRAATMIVAQSSYEVTDPTVDSQIVALRTSGADTLFNVSLPKFALQSIKKVGELGWKPTQYLCNSGNNVGLVMLPAGAENTKGIITASHMKDPSDPVWQTGKEWEDYLAWARRYFPEGNLKDNYPVFGYSAAQTMVQVLKQAGSDLSRENVMKQAASLDLQLPMLLPGVRIKTAANDYFPVEQMQLLKFNGANWERFGKVYEAAQ